jgi:hypothetical protein
MYIVTLFSGQFFHEKERESSVAVLEPQGAV